jgi:16S rRNA (cytidine1402-2'-O)-methyltransferase
MDNIPLKIEQSLQELEQGTLYIVSTPIGNLKDISFRALHVLRNVDFIAAEDTRVTANLLNHFGIKKKIISNYSKVESSRMKMITDELLNGKSVALTSDAGTPCISDPGSVLVSECVKLGINIRAIPGASSLIHSLVISGYNNKRFFFQGFLPIKGRENVYYYLRDLKMPIIIFESKFRIKKTLNEIYEYLPGRFVTVSRELTKMFEENIQGKIKDLVKNINAIKEKGEFVIIIDNQ